MHADQMAMVLRERAGLEGADLGVRLLQRHAGAVYRPWLAMMIPLVCACLLLGFIHAYLAAFVIWWLAPVGERVVVLVLSRAAFQQDVSWKSAIRETFKTGMRGIFWQLTILRLSPYRGLLTPVMTLERPNFSAYRERAETLSKDQRGAIGTMLSFGAAEGFVILSVTLLFGALMPQHAIRWEVWFERLLGDVNLAQQISNVLYGIVILCLRPFYAAAGFGLYLSRRTELEGWDVELTFRAMARRFAGLTTVLLTVGLLGIFGGAASARAEDPHLGEDTLPLSPVEHVNQIVDEPPYKNPMERKSYFDYTWLDQDAEDEEVRDKGWDWGNFDIGAFLGLASFGIAELLKLCALVLLALLIYLAVRACMKIVVIPEAGEPDIPESFGVAMMDEAVPESLPTDPGAIAAGLAAEGELREALSLLIRAGILHFRERAAIPIPAGATEGDCIRRIRGRVPTGAFEHFRKVARLWQTLAYAARPVQAEQIIELANQFEGAYGTLRSPGAETQ